MLPEKPWKIDSAFRLLLGLFASMLAGALLINWLHHASGSVGPISITFGSFIIGTLCFHAMGFLLTWIFLQEHGIGWAPAFGFNAPRFGRALLLAVIVAVAVLPIELSLNQVSARVLQWAHVKPELQKSVQTLQTAVSLGQKIYFGLVAILIAPVVEELIFRGILYPTVKARGYPRLALWGTSIFFAASHANLMTFVPLTFLGLILTLLYENTENLLAPILTHSLFNAANFFWLVNFK